MKTTKHFLQLLLAIIFCTIILFHLEAAEQNIDTKFPFKTPFYVKDSVIYDQDNRVVKLWGVNYLAPFNHNYANIDESGIDHTTTIDKDLEHFGLIGIDFIRVHLYDREITDAQGNLIENKHLKMFDYLIEQADKRGIFLMLTPTVWWNTVENEIRMRKGYAYWDLSQQQNFGFSNYFAKHAMLWHPLAIECQKTYLKALFNHRNAYSGKRLCEYKNIVTIELINEPEYIYEGQIDYEPLMGSDIWLQSKKPNYLKQQYDAFVKTLSEIKPRKELMPHFRAKILSHYFSELLPIVDEYFADRVITSHIEYSIEDSNIIKAFQDNKIDAVNVGAYALPTGKFDGGNTDWANFLLLIGNWLEHHQKRNWSGHPKIVYEYGASGSLEGYVLGAYGATFRRANIQMAAYFTYTPSAVAAYNPGWLIHYLNLEHTPNKVAGFAAAGEIFRGELPIDKLARGAEQWIGPDFVITRKPSNVDFYNGKIFRYAASTSRKIDNPSQLEIISGRGNSFAVECNGNGFYYLNKLDEKHWKLYLFANEKIVNDPAGVQTFRSMANRYMNINDMPVVSRLLDQPIQFKFNIGNVTKYSMEKGTISPKSLGEGKWELYAGEYILELK
ncbi:MAG: hypothetical protein LBP87_11880 [Planctomycetaceae bacterium]|jgi:hypothetical protein|nr:hypothetical protein [Planctomycetaceae bacterium]